MSFEPRDNSGALFKNEDRQKETHAHARGSCVVDGVHYFVDAWTKDGNKGKWQSLSFKKKDKQPAGAPPSRATVQSAEDDDTGPPF